MLYQRILSPCCLLPPIRRYLRVSDPHHPTLTRFTPKYFWTCSCTVQPGGTTDCASPATTHTPIPSFSAEISLIFCHVFPIHPPLSLILPLTHAFFRRKPMHFDPLHALVLSVCPPDASILPIGPMFGPTILLFRFFTHLPFDSLRHLDGTYPSSIARIF